jgi:hypothetical protein
MAGGKSDARSVGARRFVAMVESNMSAKLAVARHFVPTAGESGNAEIVEAHRSAAMVEVNGCAKIADDVCTVKFRACART